MTHSVLVEQRKLVGCLFLVLYSCTVSKCGEKSACTCNIFMENTGSSFFHEERNIEDCKSFIIYLSALYITCRDTSDASASAASDNN